MDTLPIKRKKPCRSSARKNSSPMMFLPEDLLAEILPFFNVKTIIQLKCLSKSLKTFISDSNFVQKHLKNSSQNPHLTLFSLQRTICFNVVPFPVNCLLKNPCKDLYYSKTFQRSKHRLDEELCEFIGSCNGLLCLLYYSKLSTKTVQLCFWNPATRTKSQKLGLLGYYENSDFGYFQFTFGYDASKRIYKVVACRARETVSLSQSEVKVFSVGDNCWRNIQSFPVVPFKCFGTYYQAGRRLVDGVHFSGTVNWLALDESSTDVEHFVIVSLDLSTETYKQFMLPPGFDEVSFFEPVLRILMDCLCFSQDSNKTEFVLWQMKEYGVQESWTQLFQISYENLQVRNIDGGFRLVCIYVNGDKAIFANKFRKGAFIYDLKDKTIKTIECKVWIHWFDKAKDYVESLVSVC